MSESTDPHCISRAEAAALLRGAPWRRLVGVGDSIVEGVREPTDGYDDLSATDRVAAALTAAHPDATAHNLAERDLVLREIRERQLDAALALKPDLVLLSGGGNDAMRRGFDPDRVRHELLEIAEPIAAGGALVVTIGLFDIWRSGVVPDPPAATMAGRFDALDELTAAVAAYVGGVHVDLHHHPCSTDRGIFSRDLVHCNARGHAIAATATLRAIAARLAG